MFRRMFSWLIEWLCPGPCSSKPAIPARLVGWEHRILGALTSARSMAAGVPRLRLNRPLCAALDAFLVQTMAGESLGRLQVPGPPGFMFFGAGLRTPESFVARARIDMSKALMRAEYVELGVAMRRDVHGVCWWGLAMSEAVSPADKAIASG